MGSEKKKKSALARKIANQRCWQKRSNDYPSSPRKNETRC